jgi:DNA repair protein RadC
VLEKLVAGAEVGLAGRGDATWRTVHSAFTPTGLLCRPASAAAAAAEEPEPMFARLRQMLLQTDDELDSRDILGLGLSFALPLSVAAAVPDELLARFGCLGGVLAAPVARLQEALGSGGAAILLKVLHAAARRAIREPLEERPIIGSAQALMDYLAVSMRHEPTEMMRLLLLDKKNGLIKDELHSRGTVDHVPLYPREIIRRVLEVEACALILVHNHPSGDPTPSAADITMTRQLAKVLEGLDVQLHDHVVVGRNRQVSMRQQRLL